MLPFNERRRWEGTVRVVTTVSQVMTRDPVVAHPSMPVGEAAIRMADRGVGGLPVVDGLGRVVGMIAEGDVFPVQRAGGQETGAGRAAAPTGASGPVVADVMTMPAVTCSPELTVSGAVELMRRTGLRRVAVVGVGGVLLGVVSRHDLARDAPPGRTRAGYPATQA